jgi:hypothetical protein
MSDSKAAPLENVENAGAFHAELTTLLKKYYVHPGDGKFQLTTADFTLRASGDISGCKPECIMRTPVKHPNGTVTIDIWCAC